MTDLLAQLHDPQSANYRRFLTAEEFAQMFGPAESDYAAVIAFAQAHNLIVTGTYPNRTLVDVSGPVPDIEQAFQVHVFLYQHPYEPRQFHAPDVEPSVDLPVPLLHISGLSDYTVARPLTRTGSGPSGTFIGRDFRAAYVPDAAALTGAGQTVALVQLLGDYYQSDITNYEAMAGLTNNVTVQRVPVDGYDPSTNNPNNWEASLDIEMAIAMAPGLNSVLVFEGPAYTQPAPLHVLNTIATSNTVRQISCSYFSIGSPSVDQVFQQFAAQGQTFFNCSGDAGAYNYLYYGTNTAFLDPMEDAWITTVGGTDLTMTNSATSYSSETVWHFAWGEGSGGGFGVDTNIPSSAIPWWQAGVPNQTNQASTTNRNFPDVAMVANDIYITCGNGSHNVTAGTSAAAPLWAGFTALVNQQAATSRYPPVGFLNPALYAIGQGPNYNLCFHDITTGSNSNQWSTNHFWAVQGYDLCTGWGTPRGIKLINELILVCDGPLSCGAFSGSSTFSFNINSGAAFWNNAPSLYKSTDLSSWTVLETVPNVTGFQAYSDTSAGGGVPYRFYALTCPTNPWRATGFVRRQVNAGAWDLIANPVDAPVNTLDGLFNPMPDGNFLPDGAQIYKQNTNGAWTFDEYKWTTNSNSWYKWNATSNSWTLDGAGVTLSAGEGFWITDPSLNSITLPFAGLVRQGAPLVNPIPAYEWIYSSMVPQTGGLTSSLGYTPQVGDHVYIWKPATGQYDIYTYAKSKAWSPSEPSLQVGQSFVLSPAASNVWTRSFSACP